jgi:hypothetical protein
MKAPIEGNDVVADESTPLMSNEAPDRREVLIGSAVTGATLFLPERLSARERKKTFTILHLMNPLIC